MKIRPCYIEHWFEKYDNDNTKYDLGESCVDSISLEELLLFAEEDPNEYMQNLKHIKMGYGKELTGSSNFKKAVCSLYKTITEDDVVSTHGAAGANHLAFNAIVEPGDRVISVFPTYSQLYAIPESLGADLQLLNVGRNNDYLPDLDELRNLVDSNTKLICINNPHNPSGKLIPEEMMREIAKIADSVGAYVLSDETYRFLNQEDQYTESMVDIYDKAISISSVTKVFSLAGVRLGWIACKDENFMEKCATHREYNSISCGLLDELFAAMAIRCKDKILARNQKVIRDNVDIIEEWMEKYPQFSYTKPEAGTTMMVYYDFDIDPRELAIRLKKERETLIVPGDVFEIEENCFRIGYGNSTDQIIGGLEQIADFLKSESLI
jgi:aspartate/methionine/tyrosine aminotransferase